MFFLYNLYSITVESAAAPHTTLWGGPGPRFEPWPTLKTTVLVKNIRYKAVLTGEDPEGLA